jgi:hypothetical protein
MSTAAGAPVQTVKHVPRHYPVLIGGGDRLLLTSLRNVPVLLATYREIHPSFPYLAA